MRLLLGISALLSVSLVAEMNAWAQFDDLKVSLTPGARQYCHVIRFPQPWAIQHFDDHAGQRLFFGLPGSDYEFRVEGVLSTKFLVAGFTEFVGRNYYTNNRFKVDLSDPAASVPAVNRKVWENAAVVPLNRKSVFLPGATVTKEKRLEFNGFEFNKTGDLWGQPSNDATRLSADQSWLVLQSRAVKNQQGPTRVFFDFFQVGTGQKLFTIEGTYSSINAVDPDGVLAKTGWLTERYFIVPLGKTIERCLVCDFGGRNHEKGTNQ
jgi:hypothetical protein